MDEPGMLAGAGAMGLWQLVMVILYLFLVCFPISRILARVGFSGWWALLALIPLVNLLALWIFAYSDWPRLSKRADPGERTL